MNEMKSKNKLTSTWTYFSVCAPGYGADGCVQCSSGTYKASAGNDTCSLCPASLYQGAEGIVLNNIYKDHYKTVYAVPFEFQSKQDEMKISRGSTFLRTRGDNLKVERKLNISKMFTKNA